MTAQVCACPAATDCAPASSLTVTGVDRFVNVPSPSWPDEFRPQQFTAPPFTTAQVWEPPDANDGAAGIGVTAEAVSGSTATRPLDATRTAVTVPRPSNQRRTLSPPSAPLRAEPEPAHTS